MGGAEQAAEPARRRRMALALGQQADGDRRQGPRQGVGGEHREHDGQSQRREEVLRRAVEEDDRREHRADGERRDEGGDGDAGSAMQRRLRQRLVLLGEQAVRVLDRHRGIVDQDADGERQAAQGQGVDGLAQEVERHQRRQDRQRNGDHHDQGRSPRTQEQQDHEGGERGGDRALAQHADQRLLDEHRLVEQLVDLEARRGGLADRLQGVLDGIDDLQRRGVAVLDDAEQDRALAVLAHDVLLDQPAVMHLARRPSRTPWRRSPP